MELNYIKQAHALRRANDMKGAFIAYRESATQENDADAHAWLSTCFLMGHVTDMDPQKAFEHASQSAAASNPLGKNNLGYCLQHGIGTEPDPKAAFQLFQESAATGNPLAYNNLGLCLAAGIGCAEDVAAAAEYFKKSASLGDSFGMNSLGNAYYTGQGVPCDHSKAFKMFAAASSKGNPTATFNLACCFLTGNGTEKDVQTAMGLFETASEGGVPAAQYRMGCMCRDGVGCDVDVERARGYFRLAADQGHSKADIEFKKMSDFGTGTLERFASSFQGEESTPNAPGSTRIHAMFAPEKGALSLSPKFLPPTFADVLESIRHNRVEQTIAGISQHNQEMVKAASAIQKRYEAKVTTALKEFHREITELEQQISMRRVNEALDSCFVPTQSPLSIPAAGTLKSKQKGFNRPKS